MEGEAHIQPCDCSLGGAGTGAGAGTDGGEKGLEGSVVGPQVGNGSGLQRIWNNGVASLLFGVNRLANANVFANVR